MKRITWFTTILLIMSAEIVTANLTFNYIDSDDFMTMLNDKKPVHMVDIQKKNDFLLHHFSRSIDTTAYPVKSEKDKNKIKAIIGELQATGDPVVIIGPRGTRPSRRAYTYLTEQGIAPERLAILEKGVRGWPEQNILVDTYGH